MLSLPPGRSPLLAAPFCCCGAEQSVQQVGSSTVGWSCRCPGAVPISSGGCGALRSRRGFGSKPNCSRSPYLICGFQGRVLCTLPGNTPRSAAVLRQGRRKEADLLTAPVPRRLDVLRCAVRWEGTSA